MFTVKGEDRMKLGKQIRKLRMMHSMSQDELAVKMFVSRQTVSNWETDKSYPDIHSLLLLSRLFSVSIDELIKEDIDEIKAAVDQKEIRKFRWLSYIYAVLLFLAVFSLAPLVHYLSVAGLILWILFYGFVFYIASMTEKEKKRLNLHTYKEITAFLEGKQLSVIEQAREEGKRHYQTVMYMIVMALFGFVVCYAMLVILS